MNKSIFPAILLLGLFRTATAQEKVVSPPDTIVSIDEVTISAYRTGGSLRTTPGSISVLTAGELEIENGIALSDALNIMPGLTVQSGTLTTGRIVIRGMGSRTPYNTNRIRAYLNDIPLTSADGISSPEDIDPMSLGKVEVVKGPSSALYGSGLGGSINMYTPHSDTDELIAGITYGSYNTLKANTSVSLKGRNASYWGSFNRTASDGYRENNRFGRTSWLSSADWKYPGLKISTTLLLTGIRAGIPSSIGITAFTESPSVAAPNWLKAGGYEKSMKGIAALSVEKKISTRLTGSLMLFGKLNDSYEKRPFNNLDDQSVSEGMKLTVNYGYRRSAIVAGSELISERYRWTLDENSILLNRNREARNHVNLFGIWHFRATPDLFISAAGAFNKVSYRLTDLFPADGDRSARRSFPLIFSPRLGINYSPGSVLALYASAGHGFSMPSPEETLLPEGDVNPGIKPEQGIQYEAGARLNWPEKEAVIDASVYLIELNNLLVTKRVTEDIFTGINAGQTRHLGLEMLAKACIFKSTGFPGKLVTRLSYFQSLNRFVSFIDDNVSYNGNQLPGIPRMSLHLLLDWNALKQLVINTHLIYNGKQFLNDANSLDYPGYLIINAGLGTTLGIAGKEITFKTGINNLTGTHYASMVVVNATGFNNTEPRYYYPGLPRNMYAGIFLNFGMKEKKR